MNVTGVVAVIAFLGSALIAADADIAPPALAKFKDPSLPPDVRVKELISNMTLEEKAAQLGHAAPPIARLGIPEYNWWNEGRARHWIDLRRSVSIDSPPAYPTVSDGQPLCGDQFSPLTDRSWPIAILACRAPSLSAMEEPTRCNAVRLRASTQ
jgi:hypothetical protein